MVLDNGQFIEVDRSPTALIDWNLRHFGSSLKGAIDGMKDLLKNANMMPVVMSEAQNIYWFPSKSTNHPECVWFALRFIDQYEYLDKKKTRVVLTNGHTITIEMSLKAFESRLQRTYMTKYKMEYRVQQIAEQPCMDLPMYYICKESKGKNYMIKRLK